MKLLLDGHIKKAACPALQRLCPGCEAVHISDWQGGLFRTSENEDILVACFEENRVLITYDLRTVPGLLRRWAAEERSHAGVIFADSDSVPASDPGAVATALSALIQEITGSDMTNVVRYLRRR